MNPPILLRRPADRGFEERGVPLRDLLEARRFRSTEGRVGGSLEPHVVVEQPVAPRRRADHDRCPRGDRKQADRLVDARRTAEELDPRSLRPGGLIAEEADGAVGLKGEFDIRRAPLLGEDPLPARLAKLGHKPVEERVVENAGHGINPEAKHPEQVGGELEIAIVPREHDLWPVAPQQPHHRFHPVEAQMLPPGRLLDHALGVGDLHDHEEKVLPHPLDRLVGLGLRPVGKGDPQVLADDRAADPQRAGDEPGEAPGPPFTRRPRKGLNDTDRHPDGPVGHPVADPMEKRTGHGAGIRRGANRDGAGQGPPLRPIVSRGSRFHPERFSPPPRPVRPRRRSGPRASRH